MRQKKGGVTLQRKALKCIHVTLFWGQLKLISTCEGVQMFLVLDCNIETFSVIAEGSLAFNTCAERTAGKQRYFTLLWEMFFSHCILLSRWHCLWLRERQGLFFFFTHLLKLGMTEWQNNYRPTCGVGVGLKEKIKQHHVYLLSPDTNRY